MKWGTEENVRQKRDLFYNKEAVRLWIDAILILCREMFGLSLLYSADVTISCEFFFPLFSAFFFRFFLVMMVMGINKHMEDPLGFKYFREYLKTEFSEENLDFSAFL